MSRLKLVALYGCYCMVVFILALCFLFPADKVQDWFTQYMQEGSGTFQVVPGDLALLPHKGLVMKNIRIHDKSAGVDLFRIQEIRFWPALIPSIRQKKICLHYALSAHDGTGGGMASLTLPGDENGEGSVKEAWNLTIDGRIQGIVFEQITDLKTLLGRSVQGELNSQWHGDLSLNSHFLVQAMQIDVRMKKVALGLQAPVLGQTRLFFDALSFSVRHSQKSGQNAGPLQVQDGQASSPLFMAAFEGVMHPGPGIKATTLSLQGRLAPRPEFFVPLAPSLGQAIQTGLQGGKLEVVLNGSLTAPGLRFPALQGVHEERQ